MLSANEQTWEGKASTKPQIKFAVLFIVHILKNSEEPEWKLYLDFTWNLFIRNTRMV